MILVIILISLFVVIDANGNNIPAEGVILILIGSLWGAFMLCILIAKCSYLPPTGGNSDDGSDNDEVSIDDINIKANNNTTNNSKNYDESDSIVASSDESDTDASISNIELKHKCVICFEMCSVNKVLYPCKHTQYCDVCVTKINKCSLCNSHIERVGNIYV